MFKRLNLRRRHASVRAFHGVATLLAPLLAHAPAAAQTEYVWSNVTMGGGGFVSAVVTTPSQKNLIFIRTDVGGAYRWADSSQSWIPLTDWVSVEQTGFLGVESIAIDPSAPSRVYLLVGTEYFNNGKTAILRSTDYGDRFSVTEVTDQFKAHGNGMGRQSGERLAVDPNSGNVLFCGTRRHGLFKSTDYGATWIRVPGLNVTTTPNGNGISFVLFDKSSGRARELTRTLYAGISRSGAANLYVSTDAGVSWSPLAGAPTDLMPQRAALGESGRLYITYGNGAGPHPSGNPPEPMDRGAVWRYETRAKAWKNITPTGANRAYSGISVDASNPKHIVATTVNTYVQQPWGFGDHIFRSENGGDGWTALVGERKLQLEANGFPWIVGHAIHWAGSIEIDPFNPERAFVTSGNGVFMSEDLSSSRSTWKFAARGIEETVPNDLVSIPGGPLVSVVSDYDGFVHTDLRVSPERGRHTPPMGTTTGLAVAAAKTSTWVRVGKDIYWTDDAGSSWKRIAKPAGARDKGKVALSADGATLLWCPERSSTTYRTSDRGSSWTPVVGLSFPTTPIADTVNPRKFYAYDRNSGAFLVSTDQGSTFSTVATLTAGGSNILRAVPGVEGGIWIALHDGGLTRSSDSGAHFTRVPGVEAASAVGFGAAPAGKTFPTVFIWGSVGGTSGIYRSDDAGGTWLKINDDAHQYGGPGNGQFVIGDMNVLGRVYMSTVGRGIVVGEPNARARPAAVPAAVSPTSGRGIAFRGCGCRLGSPLDAPRWPLLTALLGASLIVSRSRRKRGFWTGGRRKRAHFVGS